MAVTQNPRTGKWEADFRDQKRKRHQKTFLTQVEAQRYYDINRAKVHTNTFIGVSKDTIADLAWKWWHRKKKMGSYRFRSLQNWEAEIKYYIVPELGHLMMQKATVDEIEQAALVWKDRTSGQKANKVLTTLTSIFYYAQRVGPLDPNGTNVAARADRIKLETDEEDDDVILPEDVYDQDEIQKMIDATEPGTIERVLLALLAFCGLRIGEALGLTWAFINLDRKIKNVKLAVRRNLVTVERDKADFPGYGETGRALKGLKTKNGKRDVPLAEELRQDLRLWKLKCPQTPQGIVLATEEGVPLQPKKCQAIMDAACEKAGVTKRNLHRLRHSYGSILIQRGARADVVSEYMGHASAAFTLDVYVHFLGEDKDSVQEMVSSIMSKTE